MKNNQTKKVANSFLIMLLLSLFLASCGSDDSSSGGGTPTVNKDFSATAGSYGQAIFIGEPATPSPLTGLNPSV